jgi:hypothetical protein
MIEICANGSIMRCIRGMWRVLDVENRIVLTLHRSYLAFRKAGIVGFRGWWFVMKIHVV